jgi:glycerol-3-phosphate dehydrogenase (NAD(P)+)
VTTAIIGAGAWGAAMAGVLVANRRSGRVLLWGREAAATRARAAPGVEAVADPRELAAADLVLWAVPCQRTRAALVQVAPHLPQAPTVSLSKGLEEHTHSTVSALLAAALPGRPVGALSGPSLAAEVAAGAPVGLVAAGPAALTRAVVGRLHAGRMRIYTTEDLVGVELAGALKNVVAIAAGLGDGLGLGDNAKAALMTRGLAEIRRLGRSLGADDQTFAGLAGMGDLAATCWSRLSRNRGLGEAVARGGDPARLLAAGGPVAEGAWTARAATSLAALHAVPVPIAAQVESVLWGATSVASALDALLSRAPKEENA